MSPPHVADHARAITLLSLAAAVSGATGRLCDPMLVELGRSFSVSHAQAASVISGCALTYGIAQLFFGPLGEKVGKYRLVALTTLACTLGSLMAAMVQSLDMLILARVLNGLTAAGIIPLSMAWIGDTVPYEQRQTTLARYLIGQISGVIAGQFIGGLFTDTIGWRWAFAFIAACYVVIGLLMLREARLNPVVLASHQAGGPTQGIRASMREVISRPWARIILLVVFLEGAAIFGALALVPSDLHLRFGLELTSAGALMAFFGLGGLTYTFFSRQLVGRLGETGLAAVGGVILAIAWGILALATTWPWAIPTCFFIGIGYYMLHNTLQTNATQMAATARGTAVSLFASAFFLGQSLGVAMASTLMISHGAQLTFALSALSLLGLGLGFSWLLRFKP